VNRSAREERDLTEVSFGLSFFTLRTEIGMVLAEGSDSVFIAATT